MLFTYSWCMNKISTCKFQQYFIHFHLKHLKQNQLDKAIGRNKILISLIIYLFDLKVLKAFEKFVTGVNTFY